MKRFLRMMYDWTLRQAASRAATPIMMAVSFIDSIFFPIPPDVMLIPMTLSKPRRGLVYALFCTLASVCGALVGYQLGRMAAGNTNLIESLFSPFCIFGEPSCQNALYSQTVEAATKWGGLLVFVAAVSLLPFKAIVISAGIIGMPILPFILGAVTGRALRYGLICGLLQFYGEAVKHWIEAHMIRVFSICCLVLGALIVVKFLLP